MTPLGALFTVTAAVMLICVPRRWAPIPLLAAACYMTVAQLIMIGPFHFASLRIVLAVGVIRVLLRSERPAGGLTGLDWLIVAWAAWALCASGFHQDPRAALITTLGRVYDSLGVYFLIRCFCQSEEDVVLLVKIVVILLMPLALEMLNEQLTHRNLFSVFGGVPELPIIRGGRLRSQGPFLHAILAGTVGAVCIPMLAGIWRRHPWISKAGLLTCLVIIVTSASSGPLLTFAIGVFGLILWRWRHQTRNIRIAAVTGYLMLDLYMRDPAYYILAKIDLTGSSTGWHRARLIQSAFEHLSEWWLVGTDYTRHWMPTYLPVSPNHCDITNHYLVMGVMGGFPLMMIFVLIVWWGFRYVSEALRLREEESFENRFLIWTQGATLFAHAVTFISVAYFDQTIIFFHTTLAIIVSLWTVTRSNASVSRLPDRVTGKRLKSYFTE